MKKILHWLDNYWYHYKWATIIGVFVVVIVTVMVVQLAGRDEYDLSVIYAGQLSPTANQTRDIETELGKLVPDDRNGDGKKNCQLNSFFLLTEEQIAANQKDADARGEVYVPNRTELANTRQQFTNQVFAGEASVCILDPAWYKLLLEQDAFVPLSELTDEVPEYANDEYSLRLRDTPFAQYFSAMSAFPEDTLLCFRRLSTTTAFKSREAAEESYNFSLEFFRSILNFSLKG